MIKKLIFIFIILGIILLVFASRADAIFNSDGRLGNETFDNLDNWTQMAGDDDCTLDGGMMYCANQRMGYLNRLPNVSINTNNFSCEWDMSAIEIANGYIITQHWADDTSDTGKQVYQINYQNGNFNLRRGFDGDIDQVIVGVQDDSTWHNWKVVFLTNYTLVVYINGTWIVQSKPYPLTGDQGGVPTVWEFTAYDGSDEMYVDNFTCYNGTEYPAVAPPPDLIRPVITIVTPANDSRVNKMPLNITISVADGTAGNMLCRLDNATQLFDSDTIPQNTNSNLTFSVGVEIEQDIIFNITCYDNAPAGNQMSEFLNLSIDTIFPTLTITNPQNKTAFDKFFVNLTYDATCTDQNLLAFNISLFQANGTLRDSVQNNSIGLTSFKLDSAFDISDNPIGEYTMNFTCVDAHTYFSSKVDRTIRDDILDKLYYETQKNDLSVQLVSSTLSLCDFNSYSLKDREVFWYDFGCNKEEGIFEYIFMLRDNNGKLKYLPESRYKAHFVTETHFITFHLDKGSYRIRKFGKDYEIRITTNEKMLDFKNSIGGLNRIERFLDVNITESTFAALRFVSFQLPDIILDSDVYTEAATFTFSLSRITHMSIKNSLMASKFSLPQASTLSSRITHNEIVLFEGPIRTISNLADIGSASFQAMHTDGVVGENNITIEFKEDGTGAVNISRFIIVIDTNQTNISSTTSHTHASNITTFSNTAFDQVYEFSMLKNVEGPTYIDIFSTLSGTESMRIDCKLNRTESSPIFSRFLSSSSDIGSAGTSYINNESFEGIGNFNLSCKTSAGTATINSSIFAIDLINNISEEIASNFNSNILTDENNFVDYAAGVSTLASIQHNIRIGTDIIIIGSVSIQSTTGTQTPRLFIDGISGCTTEHFRYLSSNDDIGSVKMYLNCSVDSLSTIDVNLKAEVEAGETLRVLDESISLYEAKTFDITTGNVAPIVTIIDPVDNGFVRGFADIRFITFELNNDDFITNISVINSTDKVTIADGLSKNIQNISYNFSVFGAGTFTLNVSSHENVSGDNLFGFDMITITVTVPSIDVNLSSPSNNSGLEQPELNAVFIVDTDNVNCSLFIDNIDFSVSNQTIVVDRGQNTFPSRIVTNGTHTWAVRCINSSLSGTSGFFNFTVDLHTDKGLSLLICPETVAKSMMLWIIVFFAAFFMLWGWFAKIGFIGFFGSLMLMIFSWYFAACLSLFAYIIGLFSFVLIIFFVVGPIGFNNEVFK